MAEHRAIKSAIWDDTWFGRLSPFEMVVWIGLFSKCADDQGRLQDDPALIRSKLFPFQDVTMKEIDAAMATFNGHIIRYEKGERLAQLVRWFDNQPMQYAVPSNFPPPDGWIDRYRTTYKKVNVVWNWGEMSDTSIGILLWQGLSILQRGSSWTTYLGRLNTNPNPIPNSVPNPIKKAEETPPPSNIFQIYTREIGVISPMVSEELKLAETEYPNEWFQDAFKEAVDHNARSWAYVQKVLQSWKINGKKGGNGKQPKYQSQGASLPIFTGREE